MKNNKTLNDSLKTQLASAIQQGRLKVKYFRGYEEWKAKLNYWCKVTKGDVSQALSIMYGPNGGVEDYRGSLYTNANIEIGKAIQKRKANPTRRKSKNLKTKPSGLLKNVVKFKNRTPGK